MNSLLFYINNSTDGELKHRQIIRRRAISLPGISRHFVLIRKMAKHVNVIEYVSRHDILSDWHIVVVNERLQWKCDFHFLFLSIRFLFRFSPFFLRLNCKDDTRNRIQTHRPE